jgi:cytochrome b pre-mRNA-processing protein 3
VNSRQAVSSTCSSKDMDRSLRELGVGDIGVPKKLKKLAEDVLWPRPHPTHAALEAGDRAALDRMRIARNVLSRV